MQPIISAERKYSVLLSTKNILKDAFLPCNMPPFRLQKAAYRNVKDRLLESKEYLIAR